MDGSSFPREPHEALPAGDRERRTGNRLRTICRVALITRAGDVGLWRVRNISDTGLMLTANVPMHSGEAIEIGLSETVSITGRIVWAEKGDCGVAFTHKINAAELLHSLAVEQRAKRYRALRLPIKAEAALIAGTERYRIVLVNLSQHGASFHANGDVKSGLEVDLSLCGGKLRRRALIRWTRAQRGGLWFSHPLSLIDLESVKRLLRGSSDMDVTPASGYPTHL